MEKQYNISGMTCEGCVRKVQRKLESIPGVNTAKVQRNAPQGIIESTADLDIIMLNEQLASIGNYRISEVIQAKKTEITEGLPEISVQTYKPLLLIVSFILGLSYLAQYPFAEFSFMLLMRHFMAGFFIVFAFFKLLNLDGFATSYAMYDMVAMKWRTWGFIYPFTELLLGLAYLTDISPVFTNITTLIILGISSIGVIQSVLDKKKIKCACLGDVFNLPMSTVTVVEDLSMVIMAACMLIFR